MQLIDMTMQDKGGGDTAPDEDDVPEEATNEPEILTPEEDAQRAARRLESQEGERPGRWPHTNDPLRQPGELAPAPDKRNDQPDKRNDQT